MKPFLCKGGIVLLQYILMGLVVLLSVALTVCIVLLVRRNKRVKALSKAIDAYLLHAEPMPLSLYDDRFSVIENQAAELSEQLEREKANAQLLIRNNNAFLADVSHQLKTPLAGLRLYCEMVQNAGHADIESYTQKQLILLDRTDRLVKDLLHLEKLRSDFYRPEMKSERMDDICRNVLSGLHVLYPRKKISLQGEATLRCDRTRIEEAIENIVKNACEHTKEDGCIDIEISKGESCVFVIVQDDGGGLPEAERSRLFERFYRAPDAKGEGTGLGLSITRAIIDRHHGTVSAENSRSGLRFTVCIPIEHGVIKT